MKISRYAFITLLLAVVVTAIAGWTSGLQDPQVKLKDNAASDALKLLAGLMFVTLVVERIIEVLIGKPREGETEKLKTTAAGARDALESEEAAHATHAIALAALPPGVAAPPAPQPLAPLRAAVTTAGQDVVEAKEETMKWALLLGFALGAMLSACGIRTLAELWTTVQEVPAGKPADFHWSFNSLDLFLTAGLIAGGSQGLHLLLETFGAYLKKAKESN